LIRLLPSPRTSILRRDRAPPEETCHMQFINEMNSSFAFYGRRRKKDFIDKGKIRDLLNFL
jgi:hypothetical protein